MPAPAMCPNAQARTGHTPARTHQSRRLLRGQTRVSPWHWKTGNALLGEDRWKQAYKISNMVRPYSQFAPEVPLVKMSNGAARAGR